MFATTLKYGWIILLPLCLALNACGDGTETTESTGALVDSTSTEIVSNPALDKADQFIQQNPDNALAYYDRALIHYKLLNHDPALADLEKAISESKGRGEAEGRGHGAGRQGRPRSGQGRPRRTPREKAARNHPLPHYGINLRHP